MNAKLRGKLPDFVVVGATKAGTTALDQYLALHPEIHMASPKEPRFFVEGVVDSNSGRGLDWYRSLFDSARPCCGETSPQYTHWPSRPGVMERMQAVIPHCRLIYLVRDPWSRIKSHYYMNLSTGITNLDFTSYVRKTPHVINACCYGTQMRQMLKFYSREKILVIESADLNKQTRQVLQQIFHFLGVDPTFDSPAFDRKFHVGKERSTLSPRGYRLMNSRGTKFLQQHLSQWAFYHVRNLLTWPFLKATKGLDISPDFIEELSQLFQREVDLLRDLTNQELPTLSVNYSSPPAKI
jgi:hypothetical protein